MSSYNRAMYGIRLTLLASLFLFALSCSKPAAKLPDLVQEFVYTTLSFAPVTATAAGYHQHKSSTLDEMLDQQRHVLDTFAQRRQRDREAV